MKIFTRTLYIIATILLLTSGLFAQANFFKAVPPADLPKAVEATKSVKEMGIVRLNEAAMRSYLLSAPLEFQNNGITLPLQIPLPDGKTETFGIVESPILSPAVAAQHPEIKTYTGNGLTNKKMVIRLSLTSEGFSAILLNVGGDAVYFEKYSNEAPDVYFNYFAKDASIPEGYSKFSCTVGGDGGSAKSKGQGLGAEKSTGETLRTFRLAMAADGEFTEHNGGTVGSAFAAVVGYVNRMDAVYRTELSVSFVLVSGTEIIYDDPATDPYTNDNQDAMLNENQINLDNVIGNGSYDIGHVWGFTGFSGGGIASKGSLCDSATKGQGVSGEGEDPWTQVFFDQLVFHEIGHQFGMSHSYNSNIPVCTTRAQETSVEPGSGATIMSYGFTCETDDYMQSTTEGPILIFHTVSYSQAEAYMANPDPGYGNCYDPTPTNNLPPVVTAPSDYTVPVSTPFSLTGSAVDPDGDPLTYTWEGTNVGTIEIPDEFALTDPTKPPFFRTYEPSDSPTRYYPRLDSILNNANVARGDKLPSIGVVTTHRLTVRDNYFGGGGVAFDSVTVTVDGNIGPFLETTNLSGSFYGLSAQTITWSVNGTDAATPEVNILFSVDGGYTFSTLVASTENDGSQTITLPNTPTATARIKVEAVGNIFFDISNADFTIQEVFDADGDGFYTSEDCDDTNASIYPSAPEICDGLDNNCDGVADEGFALTTYYLDADGDGYGNAGFSVTSCAPVPGYVTLSGDCDDDNAAANPAETEVCDSADNNCDGDTDEGFPTTTYYIDADSDGYGTSAVWVSSCAPVPGYVTINGDCDDSNAAINPAAMEVCDGADNNCDGTVNEGFPLTTYYIDTDGDGIGTSIVWVSSCEPIPGYVTVNGDCDDNNAAAYPGATEVCDGADNDCNGDTDEGFPTTIYYIDADGDGIGTNVVWVSSCAPVPGYVTVSGDCDDSNAATYPGATEICDDEDNDCNGTPDDGLSFTIYYIDTDGDGYGTSAVWVSSCAPIQGFVTVNGDCDDSNNAAYPSATEVCDGADNNCDGNTDEGFISTYYADTDGDGFGTSTIWIMSCSPVAGYVTVSGDCDDDEATINPDATEVCDGADNNCDGTTDEGFITKYYADTDGDGFGSTAVWIMSCSPVPGFVPGDGDCDDTNATVYPGATEVCDDEDNDCDGTPDNGLSFTTYYIDADGDGIGTSAVWVSSCTPVAGYVTINGDCNDSNAASFPGAAEICDGADNNCDGTADEGLVMVNYYVDTDGDGFGNAAVSLSSCGPVVGFVTISGDCDDTDAARFPGAAELCDGLDNDCDSVVPTNELDSDGDNISACAGDCDDVDAESFPGAAEICDGFDNDCDGAVPDTELDSDGDDFSICAGDCDDDNPARYPGATEICDGFDNNCDNNIPLNEQDGDGDNAFACNGDCNDTDPTVFPNAPELCDGQDNNCDGVMPVEESDVDHDNVMACDGDCNDTNANIHPGATEIANNGIDEDCDGEDLISGINEPSLEQLLIVTPNPFSTSLNLRCDCNASLHYTLYDQLGRALKLGSAQISHGSVEIKTPGLTPGMYYLSITDEDGKVLFVKRLVNN